MNTCHIREKAAEKVYSELGRYRKLKQKNPKLKIGVIGCVAQAEGQEIIERSKIVDMVLGPQVYHKLPEIIELKNHPWFIGVQFHPEFKSRPLAPHPLFSSFIKAAKNHK